jgi:hypothetical protein
MISLFQPREQEKNQDLMKDIMVLLQDGKKQPIC